MGNLRSPVPDGLEPLAIWDANDPEWRDGAFSARFFWLIEKTEIRHLVRTRRIEFYLLDAPFAVVHRFAADHLDRKYQIDEKPALDPPVIVPLTELPPEQLLAR